MLAASEISLDAVYHNSVTVTLLNSCSDSIGSTSISETTAYPLCRREEYDEEVAFCSRRVIRYRSHVSRVILSILYELRYLLRYSACEDSAIDIELLQLRVLRPVHSTDVDCAIMA